MRDKFGKVVKMSGEISGVVALIQSRNGVPIRLTEERWQHIINEHSDMRDCQLEILRTVEYPDLIQEEASGALLAFRMYQGSPLNGKFMVVVYREVTQTDGFIITAHPARKTSNRRRTIWSRLSFL